ncbi:hypothetical protein TNCV_772681 [Trichonephila clavipes]|nr:hypothetical protein TNCV_772681 [Trichonephila clavipes]
MYSAFAALGTLNSHRAASPLVRLVEEEERWEAFDHHRISLEFFLDFLESKVVQRKNEDELYRNWMKSPNPQNGHKKRKLLNTCMRKCRKKDVVYPNGWILLPRINQKFFTSIE